jgi:uncharacterized membrane protein YdbT with pleckstrin-like domain
MSISQDPSQKFHQYDSDDRQLLVELLHEYSGKLVKVSREVALKRGSTNKKAELIILSSAIVFSYALSSLFLKTLVVFVKADQGIGFFVAAYRILSDSWSIIVLCNTIVFLPFVFSFFIRVNLFAFFEFSNYDRLLKTENDLLEEDARLIANRLESAMRLTLEIADRVETNLARKLELDLRIGDASSALDYYYSVVNSKPKSKSKSRKVAP